MCEPSLAFCLHVLVCPVVVWYWLRTDGKLGHGCCVLWPRVRREGEGGREGGEGEGEGRQRRRAGERAREREGEGKATEAGARGGEGKGAEGASEDEGRGVW